MQKSVLVVDDNAANIELCKALISMIMPQDIKVKAALSGEIAIKQVSKNMPDLLILDLIMPNLNGFETLQAIRALPLGEQLPALIVSGHNDPEDISQGKSLGAIGHLTKPIDATVLARYLHQYL